MLRTCAPCQLIFKYRITTALILSHPNGYTALMVRIRLQKYNLHYDTNHAGSFSITFSYVIINIHILFQVFLLTIQTMQKYLNFALMKKETSREKLLYKNSLDVAVAVSSDRKRNPQNSTLEQHIQKQ